MLAGKLALCDSDKAGDNESVKEVERFYRRREESWDFLACRRQLVSPPQVTTQKGTHLPQKKPETEEQRSAAAVQSEVIWPRDLTATTIIKEVH